MSGAPQAVNLIKTLPNLPISLLGMSERLKDILSRFDEDARGGQQAFCTAAISSLRERCDTPGHEALARVLVEKDLLTEALCDPVVFSTVRAIEIARAANQAPFLLDAALARRLPDLEAHKAEHVLTILDAIAEGSRIVPMLRYLLRDSNPRLRSKASLLVGRAIRNPEWLGQQMRDAEPRVRANAIQALWGIDLPGIKSQFYLAVNDSHVRVSVNALVGLYKLGDPSCLHRLRQLAAHAGGRERASAAWAMGETGDPRFLPVLREMNPEPGDRVASNITRAIERIERARAERRDRLIIRLVRREGLRDGKVCLETAISGAGWEPINLKSTQFVVWEGPRAVDNYSIRAHDRNHALVIGFALCGGIDLSDAELEAARSAVLACLEHKRSADSWAGVRHVDETVRFTADKTALKAALRTTEVKGFGPLSKTDVLSRLADRAAAVRGDRHLIVLAGPKGRYLPCGAARSRPDRRRRAPARVRDPRHHPGNRWRSSPHGRTNGPDRRDSSRRGGGCRPAGRLPAALLRAPEPVRRRLPSRWRRPGAGGGLFRSGSR